jgi:hypothetical protein
MVQRHLHGSALARALERLRGALAATTARHEAQHLLDNATPRRMPPELAAYTGPLQTEDGENPEAQLARDELSAYLATLAREEQLPHYYLDEIAYFLLAQKMRGTRECYAALVIFAELSLALGLPTPLLINRDEIDREAVAAVYLALDGVPPEKLRDAARRSWEKLFGVPLPELTQVFPPE